MKPARLRFMLCGDAAKCFIGHSLRSAVVIQILRFLRFHPFRSVLPRSYFCRSFACASAWASDKSETGEAFADVLDPPSPRLRRDKLSKRQARREIRQTARQQKKRPREGVAFSVCLSAQRSKTESNCWPEDPKSMPRVNCSASLAPYSRSMPQSSHSIESGPA